MDAPKTMNFVGVVEIRFAMRSQQKPYYHSGCKRSGKG